MSRDGSGTYSLPATMAVTGQTASSTTVNSIMNDVAQALTDSINKDGTKTFAANQSMGGNKLTSLGAATSASDAARLDQVQKSNAQRASAVGGTVDAITLTFNPPFTALTTGMKIRWLSGGKNTVTNPSINADGLGVKTVKKNPGGMALAKGDLGPSGSENEAVYNGTDWILTSVPSASVVLNGPVATDREISWYSDGVIRWIMAVSSGAESGSNAGSDWYMNAFDDAGAYIDTYLSMSRATGILSVMGLTFSGLSGFSFQSDIGTGNPGISFDTNDYFDYDRTNNKFRFFVGGTQKMAIDANGVVGSGYSKIATVTTTSGASQATGTLDLTKYKFLRCILNGVSHTSGTSQTINLNGTAITATFGAATTISGMIDIDLETGIASQALSASNAPYTTVVNATTVLTFAPSAGNFDAGSITIWAM